MVVDHDKGDSDASAAAKLIEIITNVDYGNAKEISAAANAATALGSLRARDGVSALIGALRDGNYLCVCAAGALGKIGDHRAVAPLVSVLRDQSKFWVPRGAAAVALGDLGTIAVNALPALEEALTFSMQGNVKNWDQRAEDAVRDARDPHQPSAAGGRLFSADI
jgi:HEAT repeat protein